MKVFVGGSEPNIDGSTSTQPFTGCIQVTIWIHNYYCGRIGRLGKSDLI